MHNRSYGPLSFGLYIVETLVRGSKELLIEFLTYISMFKDFIFEDNSVKADLFFVVIFAASLGGATYAFENAKIHSQYFSFVVVVLIVAFAASVVNLLQPKSRRDPGVEYASLK